MYTSTMLRSPVEAPVPHVVDDVGLRTDRAAAPQEELQQRQLARRSVTARRRPATRGARPGPAGGRPPRAPPAAPARPRRISARNRATKRDVGERLRDVVVGAGVERLGLVELAVLGGEHQDRGPHALRRGVPRTPCSRSCRATGCRARSRRRGARSPSTDRRRRCARHRSRTPPLPVRDARPRRGRLRLRPRAPACAFLRIIVHRSPEEVLNVWRRFSATSGAPREGRQAKRKAKRGRRTRCASRRSSSRSPR